MMKIVIGLAAAGFVLSPGSITTSANAQKDPACTEKCNREIRHRLRNGRPGAP